MSALVLIDEIIRQVEDEINKEEHERGKSKQHKSWAIDANKKKEDFRNYDNNPREAKVRLFYKNQHTNQTYEFVMNKRSVHLKFNKCIMTVWNMLHFLNQVVDDSDPDTDLSQLEHAIQTAEAARKAYPGEEYDWMHVTGLIHDLGKILAVTDKKLKLTGDPQWCVVGDNFPVGCQFSIKNVFYDYFKLNPDFNNPAYNTKYGVYDKDTCEKEGLMGTNPKTGENNIIMSWGHDEYLYQICKTQSKLPIEALYMLRFHSFYPWHSKGDYMHLCNEYDKTEGLKWVKIFNQFDLYSKSTECPTFDEVKDYYKSKVEKYFPNPIRW